MDEVVFGAMEVSGIRLASIASLQTFSYVMQHHRRAIL
jgi:hypothetical protein